MNSSDLQVKVPNINLRCLEAFEMSYILGRAMFWETHEYDQFEKVEKPEKSEKTELKNFDQIIDKLNQTSWRGNENAPKTLTKCSQKLQKKMVSLNKSSWRGSESTMKNSNNNDNATTSWLNSNIK